MLGMREDNHPVRRMKIRQMPPSGNCQRIDSKVDQPKVLTISGPNPDTAPLIVYAAAIINVTNQTFGSRKLSLIWDHLNLVHRTPVCPYRSLSVATTLSSFFKNHALTGELGMAKHMIPNKNVKAPASR